MKRSWYAAACAAIVAVAACGDAELQALGELDFSRAGGSRALADTAILKFGITLDIDFPDSVIEMRVTVEDSGTVVLITPENGGANFLTMARRLADGVDQLAYRGVALVGGGSGSQTGAESAWIAGGLSGEHVPDFAGFEIGAFQVHLDRVRLTIPGSNPNGDGIWTDYNVLARIIVLGRPVE